MQRTERGFTLIELIVVIVILGILAATALPKFVNLSDDAANSAVQGVAGAMSSASSINYGAKSASSTKGETINAADSAICSTLTPPGSYLWGTGLSSILQGGLPTGYTLTPLSGGTASCAANGFVQCTVKEPSTAGKTATATINCTS